ncbi:MAG: flagellar basal-body rod protein FlgF [Acidobacteria bacterium]|nr:flagellar basal-body rod protein FlgF [Acidobacteriota bacterium]
MDPISALAASGLRSRMDTLDLLANNIANGATAGYKADRESYGRFVSEDAGGITGDDEGTSSMARIDRLWTDFSQGEIQPTGNQFDFAISGRGFFSVEGPSGTLYTRNGSFRLSPTGTLTTSGGYPVRSAGGGAIQSSSTGAIEVSQDGTIRQDGKDLGRIAIVDFAKPETLRKQGGTYFQAGDAKPQAATEAQVLQGAVEASNVPVAESTIRIVGIMRQFEMLQKAVMMAAEMGKQSLEQVAKV